MSKDKLSIRKLKTKLGSVTAKLHRYNLLMFIAFLAILYGFLLFRVNSLSNTEPSSTEVSKQFKPGQVLRIDPTVVKQLESLQDNSVSVQALFDEARSNPFQETP